MSTRKQRGIKGKIQIKQEDYLNEEEEDTMDEESDEMTVKLEDEIPSLDSQKVKSEYASSLGSFECPLPIRRPRKKTSSIEGPSKNIVKNYGKALCAFASSNIAIPYLENIALKRGFSSQILEKFTIFIRERKEKVNSIESLKRLLIAMEGDTPEEQEYKLLFKDISIIFLKYFSANWIYSGRLMHKKDHLRFRFKMLRRIQDPEHFTYLKSSSGK